MDKEVLRKYLSKAKDSFRTKKNLFVFSLVLRSQNTFTLKEFQEFIITEDLVELYTAEYWQKLETEEILNIAVKDIYKQIQQLELNNKSLLVQCELDYIENFEQLFSKDDFQELLNQNQCYYCGLTIKEAEDLADNKKLFKKNLRGWTLEIDRRNSNYEYSRLNCVMACYWCNNAKTDEFTAEEFEPIGKLIGHTLKNRLLK